MFHAEVAILPNAAVHRSRQFGVKETQSDQSVKGLIEYHVAIAFRVALPHLRDSRRGRSRPAFARQVAMYLTHVIMGMNFTVTGQLFGRDRTTVAHACALIEDCRDDAALDQVLEAIERLVVLQCGRGSPAPLLTSAD
jgi:chromosomal replication initiation ATPase DnaA